MASSIRWRCYQETSRVVLRTRSKACAAEYSDRRDLTWRLAIGKACSGRRLTSLLVAGVHLSTFLKDYIPARKDRAFTPERVNRIRWCLPVGMQAGLTKQCCARGADCAAGSRAKPSAGHLPHSPQ